MRGEREIVRTILAVGPMPRPELIERLRVHVPPGVAVRYMRQKRVWAEVRTPRVVEPGLAMVSGQRRHADQVVWHMKHEGQLVVLPTGEYALAAQALSGRENDR